SVEAKAHSPFASFMNVLDNSFTSVDGALLDTQLSDHLHENSEADIDNYDRQISLEISSNDVESPLLGNALNLGIFSRKKVECMTEVKSSVSVDSDRRPQLGTDFENPINVDERNDSFFSDEGTLKSNKKRVITQEQDDGSGFNSPGNSNKRKRWKPILEKKKETEEFEDSITMQLNDCHDLQAPTDTICDDVEDSTLLNWDALQGSGTKSRVLDGGPYTSLFATPSEI
ncbi:14000_t:CDS:1, partial [Acaulospora colombiana]